MDAAYLGTPQLGGTTDAGEQHLDLDGRTFVIRDE